MEYVWSIDRLLKNNNILKSRTGKNPITAYSETTKNGIFWQKTEIKKCKNKDERIRYWVRTKDIHKIEKKTKTSIAISVFGYENLCVKKRMCQKIYVSICVKKCFEEKHVDLLLTGEKGKMHYVLIENFNAFMYDYTSWKETSLLLLFPGF